MQASRFVYAVLAVGLLPGLAQAQSAPAIPVDPVPNNDEIVVTAERLSGSVISDVPPVVELDEAAVESYGAASITELLSSLAPQTGPGRGRGSGGPVILLNGQRISGFGELHDLPPEAIKRVQILPEEVALQYGYSADQRVVNFILKDNFRAVTLAGEYGGSTNGPRREGEAQATMVRIGEKGRLTLSGQYNNNSRILESDRGIIQRTAIPGVTDPGLYRTLSPESDTLKFNGVLNRKVTDTVSATVNASWQRDTSTALLGLPTAALTNPISRQTTTDALHGGLTLTGNIAKWIWTLTGNYDRSITRTNTDQVVTINDTARSQTDTANGIYTVSGPLIQVPAGAIRTTLKAGFVTTRLSGQSFRSGVTQSSDLARDEANGRINVDVPLANADRDVAAPLGRLSINANLAYRKLSDFGGLLSYGYGLNWQPVAGLTVLASAIGSENEPGIADLGNPVIVTPLIPTYDFTRGETVLVNRITGGNRALLTEVQRDTKLTVNYQPSALKGLTVGIDYFRNRSTNPVESFPILTPEIEAAFPGRVVRGPQECPTPTTCRPGPLVSIDSRSVNYSATRSDVVRVGFTFQKEFGMPAGGRGGGGGGPRGGGPAGGHGPGGGFGRGGDGGRWTIALYDSIRLMDQIQIRPGLPVLDLLGGSATGNSGGAARHSFDLDAGWFNKGFGLRLTGKYQSGSTVTGSTPTSTLQFGDLATFNINAFLNFDSRKSLIEAVPFLKGARLRLSVDNVFNTIRDVRDGTGVVPLGYQPGYIDPRGRFIQIDFRKRF